MKQFSEILKPYSGPSDLAADLGVGYQTARKMIERESVAPCHWVKLIDGLKGRGVTISMQDLQRLRPDLYPHLAEPAA